MSVTKRKSNISVTSAAESTRKAHKRTAVKYEFEREPEDDFVPIATDDEPEQTLFSCEVCNSTFVTSMSLARHMVYHEDMPKLNCSFCPKFFFKSENLANHINIDHGGAKFICKYCNRNLSRRDHLLRHITHVHPEYLLEVMRNEAVDMKTEETKDESGSGSQSQKLTSQNRNQRTRKPDVHKEVQNDNYSINTEDRHHSVQEVQFAEGSLDTYDDVTRINASLNGIRVERKHQCHECGASFMSKVNLNRHASTHSSDRPHKCSLCGKGFVRKEHLTKHLHSVHSGMKFSCEFCGKDISRKDHLIRHIRNVHPSEYLGIPAELVDNQNIDMSVSSLQASGFVISEGALKSMQPKPKKSYLSCDVLSCDKTFNNINDLHEHQSIFHADIRRFKCNFCPKAFKRKEHLVKHEVLHTGEKNFCCDHFGCGKEFPRKDALQDHIRRIHGLETISGFEYPCNFCEKVFLQRPNLIRHMKNIHNLLVGIEPEEELELDNNQEMEKCQNLASVFPSLHNYIAQTSQGTVSVNPIIYNGNTNQSVSFRDEVSFIQNNLQSFSCAHCKAVFNDEKQFLTHLNTHKLR